MSPEVSKEIEVLALLDRLSYLLKDDPVVKERVSEQMSTSHTGRTLREIILQRRAHQFYYNKDEAEKLRKYLDAMIASNCASPIHFPPTPRHSIRTLYLRIYQAWQWLRDQDENKQVYRDLYDKCAITQDRVRGVRIVPKQTSTGELNGFIAEDSESTDSLARIQIGITEALETPQTEPVAIIYEKSNLTLDDDQVAAIKDTLAGLEGITLMIDKTSIKIMRRIV